MPKNPSLDFIIASMSRVFLIVLVYEIHNDEAVLLSLQLLLLSISALSAEI